MLKFIIDTQLPPKLVLFFEKKDLDSIHTTNFPNGHLLQDKDIIDIAVEQARIIITKDSDFYDYFLLNGQPPKVLLLEVGNINNKELINLIDKYFNEIINYFESESGLVITRRDMIIAY
jgi:predicted nuclease of predicted toxin-antitoxin system